MLAVLGVLSYGAVAALHHHVAHPTLTVVGEGAVIVKMIVVTVLKALSAREEEDIWVISRRGDAVLALAAEAIMYSPLPVVDRSYGVAMRRPRPIGLDVAEE